MSRSIISLIVFILLIFALVGAYFLGNHFGEKKVKESFTENYNFVKEIAELASLEVNGTSELKVEAQFDNSVTSSIKKYFFENTAYLRIPYVAKFGVDLNNAKVLTTATDSLLLIHLMPVKLLSFELKMDKLQSMTQTGVFVSDDKENYQRMEKKLYVKSREQLANNKNYIKAAELQITRIIQNYYLPVGYKVKVVFDLDKMNTIKVLPKN